MAETIDEITINYEEDGIQVVKELDKEILTRGAWSTIIFKYQQWDKGKNSYGDERYTIRRYRKMKGVYSQQSKFNISGRDQGAKLAGILKKWSEES
ncbi:MAG: hypothetical protein RQ753_01220 [Desulfurivibrionaceae bacterium]|nr:hypothetical protein [Desulfobulbales bacterium]MDT8334297.1 hypothetical protein [Desulfurivibrionaceae bacterium]